jgi:hypothetical protein
MKKETFKVFIKKSNQRKKKFVVFLLYIIILIEELIFEWNKSNFLEKRLKNMDKFFCYFYLLY